MSEDTESRTGYLLGAVINGALLYVVHALPGWDLRVITDEWSRVLYPVTLALIVQVLGNLFLAWRSNSFRHRLIHILFDFASMAAVWRLVRVFPFDFTSIGFEAGNTVFRVLLYIALFGVFVGMVSSLVRLFGFLVAEKEEKDARAEERDEGEDWGGGRRRHGGDRQGEDPYAEDEE
jgi:hypothetical protein